MNVNAIYALIQETSAELGMFPLNADAQEAIENFEKLLLEKVMILNSDDKKLRLAEVSADSDGLIHKTCKSCGAHFTIPEGEAEWLVKKGLAVFERCTDCRKKRREVSENNKTDA